MSDFGNFISAYVAIEPNKKILYSRYQKNIGLKIVEKDPAWVN
jgi:hypothetical protein